MQLTIWSNAGMTGEAASILARGLRSYRFVEASRPAATNLETGPIDEALLEADVVFGQPDPEIATRDSKVRWIHTNSAGYTRYDTEVFRRAALQKGIIVTTSSSVYAEPCAEHVLAMMLGLARRLPESVRTQLGDRAWPMKERRSRSTLLRGQEVLLLGFGAIGRRVAELLAPFGANVTALRRRADGTEGSVQIVGPHDLEAALARADHVVDVLPDNEETRSFVNRELFSKCKRGALFYNIGRGTTVDQAALIEALVTGQVGGAYLDVTAPEPLPPEHPLWSAPRCWITPHTAGGHTDEEERLTRHFLANLEAFVDGKPLRDRVM
jgi:phosphoglycerate dehydrogenase-like enzyme